MSHYSRRYSLNGQLLKMTWIIPGCNPLWVLERMTIPLGVSSSFPPEKGATLADAISLLIEDMEPSTEKRNLLQTYADNLTHRASP